MITIYTPISIKRSSKYGSNYWETYSLKAGRNVKFFNDLAYDNWILTEMNPKIKMFCEQPVEIKYMLNNRKYKSIPAMWVSYESGEECFIYVKYSKELEPGSEKYENTSCHLSAQKRWCEEKEITHKVYTEKEIRGNTILLSNMKMLLPYIKNRKHPIDGDKSKITEIIVDSGNKTTIGGIKSKFSQHDPAKIREALSWMLYQGIISGNLDKIPYSNNTEVWLNDDKTHS